jgi:hypothetical protein
MAEKSTLAREIWFGVTGLAARRLASLCISALPRAATGRLAMSIAWSLAARFGADHRTKAGFIAITKDLDPNRSSNQFIRS